MSKDVLRVVTVLVVASVTAGCAATGSNPVEKRQTIDEMAHDVLARLYDRKPDARRQVDEAAGVGVFSNVNVSVLFVAGGGGYGVVVDHDTGERTYMKMGQGGVGLGVGAKDFRAVFVFHDRASLESFLEKGWEVGGEADAAAAASGKGGEANAAGSLQSGVTVYQITETGLALRANLMGTKFWSYRALNE